MPSPFPGMDPYLEGEEWVGFHGLLAAEIARQLTPRLQPHYVARTEKRYVLDEAEGAAAVAVVPQARRPDVSIMEQRHQHLGVETVLAPRASGPLRLATLAVEEIPVYRVAIRDVAERGLVTAIEILSPTNKGRNRDRYLAKRARILLSTAHLIEIDLIRQGRRVPMVEPLPPAPYFVLLSREQIRPVMDVWPITLAEPLPTIPIPLLPGDADVELDLQGALTSVYDALRYDLSLDYSKPPEAPLSPEEAAWAEQLLRGRGMR